ncbi:MAG: class I SAM-dependent methyltransferase [Actinomycetota bacterium]|nr:class I SAM-dependent methyltransferase [Actinomycetota bacterium]
MNYEIELETSPGRDQTEESLVVSHADGTTERFRLHEYTRVYGIPGLYEEVVQRRLQCASPSKLTELLVGCAADAGVEPGGLAVFDLGAGNGVVGEELRAQGVGALVGSDNIPAARDAALRDRPGLYAEYLVGDTDDLPQVAGLISEHGLNGLVAAGALGLGHITADSFHRLWSAFPDDAWFTVSLHEDLVEPGASDFGDYLAEFERRDDWGEIAWRERYRHRLTMAGDPIQYVAIVARKGPGSG